MCRDNKEVLAELVKDYQSLECNRRHGRVNVIEKILKQKMEGRQVFLEMFADLLKNLQHKYKQVEL